MITEEYCFYPDATRYSEPRSFGLDADRLTWPAPEGHALSAWHIHPQEPARKTCVVHFHGNAQNMTAHALGSYFLAQAGFRLVTFDYRGYGASTGRPSIDGIIADGRTALERAFDLARTAGEPVFGFGQSMGAFCLAHQLPDFPNLAGAILEAGLTSFFDLFTQGFPEMECTVPHRPTTTPLSRSAVPKLFIHGTDDMVVPTGHSRAMYDAAADPKDILILPGVGHIDALESPERQSYVEAIFRFLDGAERR
ncbi:MAG: alpha/beta hydrolase [Proteobacteria bacterium]|nr:alpha/beta hydrolase [Pseudomonadota bacterium]